jgi:hypothetical protein
MDGRPSSSRTRGMMGGMTTRNWTLVAAVLGSSMSYLDSRNRVPQKASWMRCATWTIRWIWPLSIYCDRGIESDQCFATDSHSRIIIIEDNGRTHRRLPKRTGQSSHASASKPGGAPGTPTRRPASRRSPAALPTSLSARSAEPSWPMRPSPGAGFESYSERRHHYRCR